MVNYNIPIPRIYSIYRNFSINPRLELHFEGNRKAINIGEIQKDLTIDDIKKFEQNTIKTNSIVYFSKDSKIPRDKTKSFFEENNLKLNKTNRIQYADTFIYNHNIIYDTIINEKDVGKAYLISTSTLKILFKNSQIVNVSNIDDIKNPFALIGEDIFNKNNTTIKNSNEKILFESFIKDKPIIKYLIIGNYNGTHTLSKYKNLVNDIMYIINNKDKINIIPDYKILGDINANLPITEDLYFKIREMLLSKDKDANKLALEMFANTDYINSSKIYIAAFYHEFSNKIHLNRDSNIFKAFESQTAKFKDEFKYEGWVPAIGKMQSLVENDDDEILLNKFLNLFLNNYIEYVIKSNEKTFKLKIKAEVIHE